ncbi:centromere protein V-like [Montipora capricornis]|uniref:centromere protein V-like n=2 Tax=Montipora TaxID=46703 RepID=UPI0035F20D75
MFTYSVIISEQRVNWALQPRILFVDCLEMASEGSQLVKHRGGCHCGKIRYEVMAPAVLYVLDCNCSICVKKQNKHFIVPEAHFTLLQGEDDLICYTFNTHAAKHLFCKTCGVQSFYRPRSNPDGYGVMPHCLDEGTVKAIKVDACDGKNWEKFIAENPELQQRSKLKD